MYKEVIVGTLEELCQPISSLFSVTKFDAGPARDDKSSFNVRIHITSRGETLDFEFRESYSILNPKNSFPLTDKIRECVSEIAQYFHEQYGASNTQVSRDRTIIDVCRLLSGKISETSSGLKLSKINYIHSKIFRKTPSISDIASTLSVYLAGTWDFYNLYVSFDCENPDDAVIGIMHVIERAWPSGDVYKLEIYGRRNKLRASRVAWRVNSLGDDLTETVIRKMGSSGDAT